MSHMRKTKSIYSKLVIVQESVTAACFVGDSKAGRGVEELYSGKKEKGSCRCVLIGGCCPGETVSGPTGCGTSCMIG